jgi:hypothetical protein
MSRPPNGQALDAAPAPVQRYLRLALAERATPIRAAELVQQGRLRLDGRSQRWMPFRARQTVVPADIAFTWTADVRALGPLRVRVVDRLADGRGSGTVRLGPLPLARAAPCLEMNAGALHRFLAEAVWVPSALLPSERLRWTPIDERRALATLTTPAATVSLEFRFDAAGAAIGIHTPARWGRFDGRYEQRAWEGHFGAYETIGGVRVPRHGDVGWYDGDEWQKVWDGELLSADYR